MTTAARPHTLFPTTQGCGVGAPGHRCGEPAVAVIAAEAFDSIWSERESSDSFIFLCAKHDNTPPSRW